MSDSKPVIPPNTSVLRQDLISNAISFLSDPNVVGTPLARRVAFLKRKGLTSAEIDAALAATSTAPKSPSLVIPKDAAKTGSSVSFKTVLLSSLVAAGVGAGVALLVHEYVIPWANKKGYIHTGNERHEDNVEEEKQSESIDEETMALLREIRENQTELIKRVNELSEQMKTQSSPVSQQ